MLFLFGGADTPYHEQKSSCFTLHFSTSTKNNFTFTVKPLGKLSQRVSYKCEQYFHISYHRTSSLNCKICVFVHTYVLVPTQGNAIDTKFTQHPLRCKGTNLQRAPSTSKEQHGEQAQIHLSGILGLQPTKGDQKARRPSGTKATQLKTVQVMAGARPEWRRWIEKTHTRGWQQQRVTPRA